MRRQIGHQKADLTGWWGAEPVGVQRPPELDIAIPAAVRRQIREHRLGPATPVWFNELGGLTFRFHAAGQFVKWSPPHAALDLAREAERLRWAGRYVVVPKVLEVGADGDGQWLRTRALDGSPAVSPRWQAEPGMAVRAIGRGLRILHDALPVDGCPFDWSVEHRVATWGRTGAAELGAIAPPVAMLVVCYGDACSPNTLIAPDGTFAGHVDLGMLGLADRWADLAVATYSLEWNYQGDQSSRFYDAYGVERDHEREEFYRRLWDVT